MNSSADNDKTALYDKEMQSIHQNIRDAGKSPFMFRVILALVMTLPFYIATLISLIQVQSEISGWNNTYNDALAFTGVLGDLKSTVDILLIVWIAFIVIRAVPLFCCIVIYTRSKKYNSVESMFHFMTLLQLFGIAETLVWGGLAVIDIIGIFKNGLSLPANAGPTYYIVLILTVLTMAFKIIQGITIAGWIKDIKQYARTGQKPLKDPNLLRFVTSMLAVAHFIMLFYIFITVLMILGVSALFQTMPYLWSWYLFFLSYLLSNAFLSSLIGYYNGKIRSRIKSPHKPENLHPSVSGAYGSDFYNAAGTGTFYGQQDNSSAPPQRTNRNSPYNSGGPGGAYPPYQSGSGSFNGNRSTYGQNTYPGNNAGPDRGAYPPYQNGSGTFDGTFPSSSSPMDDMDDDFLGSYNPLDDMYDPNKH